MNQREGEAAMIQIMLDHQRRLNALTIARSSWVARAVWAFVWALAFRCRRNAEVAVSSGRVPGEDGDA